MSFKSIKWIGTLVLTSTAAFSAPQKATNGAPELLTLKEARDRLHAPMYSPDERQLIADQAYMLINNMYVHREIKMKDFGPSADAVSRLKDMRLKAKGMKDDDFHTAMQLIFRDLHDNHTNYTAPLPLRCSYVISPFMFRDIVEDGKVKIVLEQLSRITEKVPGSFHDAKLLDELVAVDGMTIGEFMKNEVLPNSMGANPAAQVVYGLLNHSLRSLSELPVPANDTITYTFKSSAGKTYDIKTDLYAVVNLPACTQAAKNESEQTLPPRIKVSNFEHPKLKVWKELMAPEEIAPFDNDIFNEIGAIQDIKISPTQNLTYMKLASFMPEKSSVESLVHRVKELLQERSETSAALIIDVRGNGGGAVKLAEELVQIFTPSVVEPMPVRLLPNELNLNMFLTSNGGAQNGWTQDVKDAIGSHATYTKPRVLTTKTEANRYGQVWFKPVVVLTDAACYSACDLFAAGMQDHNAATIIGSHPSTGAGGANVMEYRYFRAVFGTLGQANPFKALPDGQAFRVSWRQTVRVGKNAGKLIEDRGVIPDIVINYTREDVGAGASKTFLQAVAREITKLIPKYKGSIKLASSVRMKNGESAQWSEKVVGVDTLDVMIAGKVVKSYKVSSGGETVNIQLDTKGTWDSKRFDLVGKASGKIAFRVVREIFWRGDDIVVTNDSFQEDFKAPKYLKTFVGQGSADDAWQPSLSGGFRVGKGPKYNSSVITEAFLPLDLSGTDRDAVFFLNLSLQSEDGMDVFSLIERDTETGEEKYLVTIDGQYDMKNQLAGFPLNKNKKHVEMVLEFESDENWNMFGPLVRALGVKVIDPKEKKLPQNRKAISFN